MICSVLRTLPAVIILAAPLCTVLSGEMLNPAQLPDEWRELFDRLKSRTPLRAGFTEVRRLPFRKTVVELEGTMRLVPEVGVSLHYSGEDDSMTTLIDTEGLAIRRDLGPWHPLPERPEIRVLHQAMGAMLTLDLEALDRSFFLDAQHSGEDWTLNLRPRPDQNTGRLTGLVLHGESSRLARIEANLGRNHGITIVIHDDEPRVVLQPEEYARFFR